MKRTNTFRLIALLLFAALHYQPCFSQCFEIESVLVDACGGQEGLNEMVRFKAGSTPLNCNTLIVDWPNNSWQGIVQNSVTASKTAALNTDIIVAGGCGQLIEPPGGIIPANATAILVTSYNMDTALNSFGALTENIYIIYQDATVTSGHFANFGSGLRTLTMIFNACTDIVTYDRALLVDETGANVAANGATVAFSPTGIPTYINNGCTAPVPPFTVDAGALTMTVCAGNSILLNGTAEGYQSIHWSAASGSFSNPDGLSATYISASADAGTTITLTLTATNFCGTTITDTIQLTVTNGITPNFGMLLELCSGSAAPVLVATSPNGITGSWNPSVINTTVGGSYVFTPNPGQCATNATMTVVILNNTTPNFATTLTLCTGSIPPVLNAASPNGISGSWNPSVINNTTSGNYVFTPNPGQCATITKLNVTVANSIIPNFATALALCNGSSAPVLNMTSPNGISGSWNPSVINSTTSGNYVFTPNPGQCATSVTLNVTITNAIIPDFMMTLTLCNGSAAPTLETTSPNGISGNWNPATINNTANGSYVFTPNAGQCATSTTLSVTVASLSFELEQYCSGVAYLVTAIPAPGSFDPDTANYTWTNSQGNVVGNDISLNVSQLANDSPTELNFPQMYTLTIALPSGCSATQNVTVDGIICNIPKGISPNGDGNNDTLDLTGLGVRELKIFNRYGIKVYSAVNYTNQWKGQTDSGQTLPDGTYYYFIQRNSGAGLTGWVYINNVYN
jgi:gliding motility-associated-like protein